VLVTGLAQDPDALQRGAHLRTRLVLLGRHPVRERAIGKAEPEALDELPVAEASTLQVLQRLRAREQRLMVKLDHLVEQPLIARGLVGIGFERERLRLAQLPLRKFRRRTGRRVAGGRD